MSTPHKRGPWSNTEDRFLNSLVTTNGPLNWVRIAHALGSRTPKQCRERYHQNLKPSLNHDPITAEEGRQIESLVGTIGKRWAEIARRLDGRSDNAVKNWWNGSQNRRRRLERRRSANPTSSYDDDAVQRAPLSVVSSALPVPHSGYPGSPAPGTRHRMGSWPDAALPSPCSSEPPESDSGSNYTTSPAGRSQSLHSHLPSIELPPIRLGDGHHLPESRLPRISSLTGLGQSRASSSVRLPPLTSPFQLMTAPSSPVQDLQVKGKGREQLPQQPQPLPHRQQSQTYKPSDSNMEDVTFNRREKMKLASLLG